MARFVFDGLGRRVRQIGADGSSTGYVWDQLGYLGGTVTRDPDDQKLATNGLWVDALGELASIDGVSLWWDTAATTPVLAGVGQDQVLSLPGGITGFGETWLNPGWRGARATNTIDPWASIGVTTLTEPTPGRTGLGGAGVAGSLPEGLRLSATGGLNIAGLDWLGARVYDPSSRGFLSADPLPPVLGAGWDGNPYAYAGNNPLGMVDPTGLRPITDQDLKEFDSHAGSHWEYIVAGAAIVVGVAIPEVGGMDGNTVLTALVDEPDLQRQSPAGWDMDEGNLMLLGVAGSGTSTTLSSIALTLARQYSPEDLDLFVLDMGSGDLEPLELLPHTSAYVGTGAGGKEFQARFLRHLGTELEGRRSNPGNRRRSVFLIDGLASLRDEFQDYEGQELMQVLFRAYADGPALGMNFVVSTTRAKAIPSAMDEVTVQKWLYRLADTYDYSTLGVRGKAIPAPIPGRCVDPRRTLQMHVATPAIGLLHAVQRVRQQWQDVGVKHAAIGRLPDDVTLAQLGVEPRLDGEPWLLPIGMQEANLLPSYLEVYEGEHIIIGGPARSGKSTLLLALAQSVRGRATAQGPVQVWAICDRRSPLTDAELDRVAVGADEIPALIASLWLESGPVFLLVDDAERVDDADKSLENLIESGKAGLCVVSAGRTSDLRTLYTHWTKPARKSRLGVLLQPSADYDGELLGVKIPSRAPVELSPGRGYAAMAGQLQLVQTISPAGK